MLIEHEAGLTVQNNDGVTSDVNSINFGLGVITTLRRIAHIMPEHGANVNARSKNGLDPFGLASQGRLAEVGRACPARCQFWWPRQPSREQKLWICIYT